MMSIFEELKNINKAGVFILKDAQTNSVYINYSSNIAQALARLLNTNLYFPKYSFEILDIVTNNINLRVRCQYYKDLYSSNGYNIINPKRVSNYKVVIEPIRDFRYKELGRFILSIKLVSRGYKELVVGVFNDYETLQRFLDQYYAGNLVTDIKYADNELTREYLNVNK